VEFTRSFVVFGPGLSTGGSAPYCPQTN